MYLCDLIASLSENFKNPNISQEIDKVPGSLDIQHLVKFSQEFIADESMDLYAFDRSALLAAGDMRVDRQDDVEKIAELIFATPRKVFIEANYTDRQTAFSKIRSMPETNDPMIGSPVRVGNLFNIEGNGKATMHVVWTTPKSELREVIPDMLKQSGVSKAAQKPIFNAHSLNLSSHYLVIDANNKSSMSMDEFVKLTEDPSSEQHQLLNYSKDSNKHRNLTDKRQLKEAYDLYRLNSLAHVEFDKSNIPRLSELSAITGQTPDQILSTLRGDLDGELILGMGMLALLEIDDLDIKVRSEGRRQRTRDRKGRGRAHSATKSDFDKPLLSVVNMNIGEDLVSALYSQRTGGEPTKQSTGSGSRQSPGLHPVQGHMFRARNGKIVYRKPHFRGLKSKRSLTRVTVAH